MAGTEALDERLFESSTTQRLPDGLTIDLTTEPPRLVFDREAIELDSTPPSVRRRVAVRAFDVVGALLIAVVAAPAALACAALVRATSKGPVIYGSPRHGQGGSRFDALKFRSMFIDGDDILQRHFRENPAAQREYAENFKLKNDPRITTVGRVLRKTNLDELPQLINVLRGEMSLVGPRPKLLEEADRYGMALDTVLRVKPGLTGKWQTSGRNDLSFSERIVLDVEYATTRSLSGDVVICFRTAAQMARPASNGAY